MKSFSKTYLFALLVVFLCLPYVAELAGGSYYITIINKALVFAIAATALNLVFGYGGLISLGHALFLGIGAYSVAIPSFYGVGNGFVHVAICLVACVVASAITGAISLRTRGMSFIMITLSFAQMGYFAFSSLKHFGGDDGTPILSPSTFGPVDLGDTTHLYFVTLLFLVGTMYGMAKLRDSAFGMVLRGSKQNERRSRAIGFDVGYFQWQAYVISGVICGMAGLLMANLMAFASPADMSWFVSAELIVMVVLGGVGTVLGPVIGAFAFIGLEEISKMLTIHWPLIVGLVILLIALTGKAGILGMVMKLLERNKPTLREEVNV